MAEPSAARRRIVALGRSLYERGLAPGTSGNLSVRLDDGGWLTTPTNASLGWLEGRTLSRLDAAGRHVSGDPPTKEVPLHLAVYRQRRELGAVAHLHSSYAAAVSCLDGLDPTAAIMPLTAYFAMKIGRLPLVPYFPPGDPALADAVAALASEHHAVLLANHGPVVAGVDLDAAVAAIEELEETAKLTLLLRGQPTRPLTQAQVDALRRS